MKALVVGGTRFIGAHVVRRLHDAGAQVTAFHRGTSSNPILPVIEHVLDPGAEYPITAFPAELLRDWDIVIHMVAMGEADAEAAARSFAGRTGRLVLVSSCDVYRAYGRLMKTEPGPQEAVPLREDAPLRSVLYPYRGMEAQLGAYAYDYDKILAERAVQGASGPDWTILRLPKVYGPEDNGDLSTVYGFAGVPEWRWTHGHVENVLPPQSWRLPPVRKRVTRFSISERRLRRPWASGWHCCRSSVATRLRRRRSTTTRISSSTPEKFEHNLVIPMLSMSGSR